ncbi:MAG: HlyC/CorC family transporter [Candidatus Glassbacteria bacterium]|nr:HlyC/CorC family transporter [Candidatus Glassbacteria bacterium]
MFLIFCFPLLLVLSGLFSGTETAFFSLSNFELSQLEEEHPRRGAVVRQLLEEPDFLLNGILLGNLLVNISATAVATIVLHHFGQAAGWSHQVVYLVDIVGMTLVLLISGEISPKVYAITHARRFALKMVGFIRAWLWLTGPVISLLSGFTSWFKGLFHESETDREVLEEELKLMVDMTAAQGDLELEEKKMIHNIFGLSETMVREIMVPRIDIEGVAINTPLEELAQIVKKTGHSRLPVYDGDLDNILGLLYTRDLLGYLYGLDEPQPIEKLIRDVYYVPETKFCGELLREFQQKRIYLGIVVDEYGGTEGLVTVEDIMEEIIGEIQDEHDAAEEPLFMQQKQDTYQVDGLMNVEDLSELLGISLGGEGYETLGGFILASLGRLPHPGEWIDVGEYRFIVLKLVKRRISKLRIIRLPREERKEEPQGDTDTDDLESMD